VKLLFVPVSLAGGLVAGLAGKKIFDRVWGMIDDEEPPNPKHREVSLAKMLAALALQGAIFRAVRGIADHATRRSFARFTGSWPGEERPEPEG
jgi:hypothetical protein